MKVSVVVPVYNQEVYLRDALDSLKSQTLKDIEFIIVNDGSTDKSLDIIREYADSDDRFIVIDQENCGVAAAINSGNSIARGEYLAEMDSDDYVPVLRTCIKSCMISHQGMIWTSSRVM